MENYKIKKKIKELIALRHVSIRPSINCKPI